jgi:SAM-dependent methyltransferase
MKPVSAGRWREAQQHELDFWRSWRELPVYRGLDLARYWAGERERFGLPPDFFRRQMVLDVGCGPVGLIHFLPEASLRIRMDPLLAEYRDKLPLDEPGLSVVATGERLPLPDSAVDVAICFNALDHMRDPQAALGELARVLRSGGTLLLMAHTFPRWTMPLLAADRLHPHHWTAAAFAAEVRQFLTVQRVHSERRRFGLSWRESLRPRNWKYAAASRVLDSTYVVAQRL